MRTALKIRTNRRSKLQDLLEIAAIVGVLLFLTTHAHAQASQGVQPLGGNPLIISVDHARHADAVALDGERALPNLGTESAASGEQPVMDYAPDPAKWVPLGTVARAYRNGTRVEVHTIWYPWN